MIKYLRRTWQIRTGRLETPFDGGMPFWLISLIGHLVLILFIATLVIPTVQRTGIRFSAGSEPLELLDPVVNTPSVEFEETLTDDTGVVGSAELLFDAAELEIGGFEESAAEFEEDLNLEFSENGFAVGVDESKSGTEAFANISTSGRSGAAVAAAAGAVDRISEEIIQSLEDNKTLVVWLFDQSGSLLEQRARIVARLDKVYQDLEISGLLEGSDETVSAKQRLLTDVIAFGDKVNPMLKKPTADYEQVSRAIKKIQLDTTGVERVMGAVIEAANQYKWMHKVDSKTKKRKRNVRFIIVSDEAGDDGKRTDEAVKVCRDNQIPVYVIGVPAPFGRRETDVKWVDPDPKFDQTPQVARVNQGPESLMSERLQLDLTGNALDLDMIDSGFGPFNLTRLCFETDGTYFAVHPNRNSRGVRWNEVSNYSAFLRYFFDAQVMKAYRPDYVTRRTYQTSLNQKQSRSALVRAAAFTSAGRLATPRLRFPKFDEAQFVNTVSRAQRDAARIEPKLNQLFEILKSGEQDRSQETSLRWQAGYDLAIGQALAAKVRAETYNMMLALVKTRLKFDDPKTENARQNNTWVLKPADTVETGSRSAKLAEKAKTYLQRVVELHPGTPWALIAQRELETPIGWKWGQTYTTPPGERPQGSNRNRRRQNNKPAPPRRAPPKL